MQLKAIHLFFILLASLILVCCLGPNTIEGMNPVSARPQNTSQAGQGGNGMGGNSNTNSSMYGSTAYVQPAGNNSSINTVPADQTNSYNFAQEDTSSQEIVGSTENTTHGISASEIPKGDEDLYILKSEIVPPVCPACPQSTACPREKPCPACPPCVRCPEPAFDCKKVPSYSVGSDRYLPKPMLNDFGSF